MVGAVVVFCVLAPLAFLTLFVLEGIPIWVGLALATGTIFFGWLLFFASANTRTVVMRWFPWP